MILLIVTDLNQFDNNLSKILINRYDQIHVKITLLGSLNIPFQFLKYLNKGFDSRLFKK